MQGLAIFSVFVAICFGVTYGGSCWQTISSAGRCLGYITGGITQQDCCQRFGSEGTGWTPEDSYSEGRLFYLQYLGSGAPDCSPCHGSGKTATSQQIATCESITCGPQKRCQMINGLPQCVCQPDCDGHDASLRGPVCGTDGRSYRSYCSMLKDNCRTMGSVEVDYIGRCRHSCDHVLCPTGESCIHDQNGLPHCIACNADKRCPVTRNDRMKVCGGDGITYQSMCHFRKATCLSGKSIGIAYPRQCEESFTCATLACPSGKKCLVNPTTGRPHCVTCGDCAPSLGPVTICASNGVTYTSWCNMQREGCQKGVFLETVHYGACNSEPTFDDMYVEEDYWYR